MHVLRRSVETAPHLGYSPSFRQRLLLWKAAVRGWSFENFALNVG
jgi:hypothetical protein